MQKRRDRRQSVGVGMHRAGARGGCGNYGFTLVELIVVLAIVAGLATIGYAYAPALYSRVKAAFDREDLERQLTEMPLRVRESGRGGVLTSRSGDRLADGIVLRVEGVPQGAGEIEEWRVLRVSLPSAWRMRVDRPILYHFTGACEGGEVVFSLPPVALRYVLAPPLCRPISSNAATGS
jgi:prepilin-type N-terminal cleavage/methylation domain-containing protein